MSSFAAEMRAKMLRDLKSMGITNVDESENYHIKFECNGNTFDYNTSNSWFKINGETSRGRNLFLDKVKDIKG